jgi:hypothetical protein
VFGRRLRAVHRIGGGQSDIAKAKAFQGFRVANFNSTGYGGGVAELLTSMTLLMNSAGIKAEWRVMQGRPDFFNITKKIHNALQGADINLSEIKTSIFEEVNYENAVRNRIDHDIVLVHDPQPLPLIEFFSKKMSLDLAMPCRFIRTAWHDLGVPGRIHPEIRCRDSQLPCVQTKTPCPPVGFHAGDRSV